MEDTSENAVKWYESAVFYHIYPLGMCGALTINPGEEVYGGIRTPNRMGIEDIKEIIPHLNSLGVSAVYIGPLFESMSHGYDTTDYRLVDKRLGTNENFVTLVREFHRAGIRVVVDGVFNHSGRNFFAFRDLREKKAASQYRDWYSCVNFSGSSAFNDGFSYEAWHGFKELPRFNLKNPAVKDYLKDVIRFWKSEFDIDGIRLDCADVLDFDFMKELRTLADSFESDFWLMGEVIHGDYSRWANDHTLHSVTDYEMHKGIFSGHNDHNYFEIAHSAKRLFDENGGIARGVRLYNFVENHDVDRLPDKLTDMGNWKNCYTICYTLPGIPSIYYGGEFAVRGRKTAGSDAPLRPRLLPQDYLRLETEKSEYFSHLKYLGALKKGIPALTEGRYEQLMLTNRQYAFARVIKDEKLAVVLLNNDSNPAVMKFKVPYAGMYTDTFSGEEIDAGNGEIYVTLDAYSSAVLTP